MITWRSAAVIAASSYVGEIDFSMGVISRPRARKGRPKSRPYALHRSEGLSIRRRPRNGGITENTK
jgi:hypothetical protein